MERLMKLLWGFGGYSGECSRHLINKPVSKGGQVVMYFDINHRYPRAYKHCHSLHPPHSKFTLKGLAEVVRLVSKINPLIIGNKTKSIEYLHSSGKKKLNWNIEQRKIFPRPPHICADNFFSQDKLVDFQGKKGYGVTMTCRHD